MAECLFCRLASRQAEVSIVHEDERTVTFMDIEPIVRGHMLVVPRRHAACLADLDVEDGAQVFRDRTTRRGCVACALIFDVRESTSSWQTVSSPGKRSSTCICTSSRATRAMGSDSEFRRATR